MSEQNVREAEQAADEWTKDNPYRAVVRPAFISGYQAAQAALTSSPSEQLVEVEDVDKFVWKIWLEATGSTESGMGYVLPKTLTTLITARDAQVAARVREESKERIELFKRLLRELGHAIGGSEDEILAAVAKARAALTATGGGECVPSPVLSDQLDSTPLTVGEKP